MTVASELGETRGGEGSSCEARKKEILVDWERLREKGKRMSADPVVQN